MSDFQDIRATLMSMGYSKGYVRRALSVYRKNYEHHHHYDLSIIAEIITRLKIKDKLKLYKQSQNLLHSQPSIARMLSEMEFKQHQISTAISMYEVMNEMLFDNLNEQNKQRYRSRKIYDLQQIVEIIMRLRSKHNIQVSESSRQLSASQTNDAHMHPVRYSNESHINPCKPVQTKTNTKTKHRGQSASLRLSVDDKHHDVESGWRSRSGSLTYTPDGYHKVKNPNPNFGITRHYRYAPTSARYQAVEYTLRVGKVRTQTSTRSLSNSKSTAMGADDEDDYGDYDSAMFACFRRDRVVDIEQAQCKSKTNTAECDALQRINCLLLKYRQWVDAHNRFLQKHQTLAKTRVIQDASMLHFMDVISKLSTHHRYRYTMSDLLDDVHHLIHMHAFHDVYKALKIRCKFNDQWTVCKCMLRNYKFRDTDLDVYASDIETEICVEQIMDSIHSYWLHSYQINAHFTPKELRYIADAGLAGDGDADADNDDDEKLNPNESKHSDDFLRGDTREILRMKQIIHGKQYRMQKLIPSNDWHAQNKFRTALQSFQTNALYTTYRCHINSDVDPHHHAKCKKQHLLESEVPLHQQYVHDFGIKYEYYNRQNIMFVKKKFKDLKSEMLNMLSIAQFNVSRARAQCVRQKKFTTLIRAQYNEYGIEYMSLMTAEHILCIHSYCHQHNLRTAFTQTLHKSTKKQTPKDLLKSHGMFAHLAQRLFECVQVFGTKTTEQDVWYHGVYNASSTPPSAACYVSNKLYVGCAFSATKQSHVALNHNTELGVILTLQDENPYFEMKYFDCTLLPTDFTGESEMFFMGNTPSIHGFRLRGTLHVTAADSAFDYSQYQQCIQILSDAICGTNIDESLHTNIGPLTVKCIVDLLAFVLDAIRKEHDESSSTPTPKAKQLKQLRKHRQSRRLNTAETSWLDTLMSGPKMSSVAVSDYIVQWTKLWVLNVVEININWTSLQSFDPNIIKLLCFENFINLDVFTVIFQNVERITIGNYGLNENALNHVFLFFARENIKRLKLRKIVLFEQTGVSLASAALVIKYKDKAHDYGLKLYGEDDQFVIECLPAL